MSKKISRNKPKIKDGKIVKERINKEQIFNVYLIWKSLPATWGREGERGLDLLGITDKSIRELLLIRTQTEFTQKFKVGIDCLTDWNKKIEDDESLYEERQRWGKNIMGNIIGSVYRKCLVEGDANRAKFLAQYFGEYIEKTEIRDPELAKQTEILRKILERR